MSRELLKQARDALHDLAYWTISEVETITDGYARYLRILKSAHETLTTIDAELAKPSEPAKEVPYMLLIDCMKYDCYGAESLTMIAAKYGYKVV